MKIWAHRGCSQNNPENTILSFEKAAAISGLTGIELDIQLTRDGEMVVIHDERVDRTTEGFGFVRDFTLAELKKLHIFADSRNTQRIPTMAEVFDLLEEKLKNGLKLNIELKTSVYPYPGIEEKIVELVAERGLEDAVVYSGFSAYSLEKLMKLNVRSEIAVLSTSVSDCYYKAAGLGVSSLHPFWRGIDMPLERLSGRSVRAWMSGHLYPEKPTGTKLDFVPLEKAGITDIILNEPEAYLF